MTNVSNCGNILMKKESSMVVDIKKDDRQNHVLYASGLPGSNIVDEIIPEAVELLANYPKGYSLKIELNRVPLTITQDMDAKQVSDLWWYYMDNPEKNPDYLAVTLKCSSIKDLLSDVKALGDWKSEEGIKGYLKVLAKIDNIKNGYSYYRQDELFGSQRVEGKFPPVVLDAIVEICKSKFPTDEEVFENGKVKEGLPILANYLPLANSKLGIDILYERTDIRGIANENGWKYGSYGEETARDIVTSSQKLMDMVNQAQNTAQGKQGEGKE